MKSVALSRSGFHCSVFAIYTSNSILHHDYFHLCKLHIFLIKGNMWLKNMCLGMITLYQWLTKQTTWCYFFSVNMRLLCVCISPCKSFPLCGLSVKWHTLLLWIEDQSLSISETGEGIWGNPLHIQQIIFQVDRSQGGASIMRVAHSPLPHQPATTRCTYI